jgi:hypothetical protein
MTVITVASGGVAMTPGVVFSAMPQSLFDLLQNMMDQEQWDPTVRNTALASLMAYHVATSSDDEFTANSALNKMYTDALMLLNHMYGVYSSGIYGVFTMPVDRPPAAQLSEILTQVSTTRIARSRPPLPGPKQ